MYRSLEIGGKHGGRGEDIAPIGCRRVCLGSSGKMEIIEMPVLDEDIGGTE